MWRYGGLSSARRTYELLLAGFTAAREIAQHLGLTSRTVVRHLRKLEEAGLAQKKPDGTWVGFERSPIEVANEIGTLGAGDRQAKRHAREREGFQLKRQRQVTEEEQAIQDLINKGYYWRGPFLVPPEKVTSKKQLPTHEDQGVLLVKRRRVATRGAGQAPQQRLKRQEELANED